MSYTDLPLMQTLLQSVQHRAQRNRVLSQNLANVDTPGYKAKDLIPFEMRLRDTLDLARTHPSHYSARRFSQPARVMEVDSVEETLSGNTVNLEETMVQINRNAAKHEESLALTRKYFQFINNALGRGGR